VRTFAASITNVRRRLVSAGALRERVLDRSVQPAYPISEVAQTRRSTTSADAIALPPTTSQRSSLLAAARRLSGIRFAAQHDHRCWQWRRSSGPSRSVRRCSAVCAVATASCYRLRTERAGFGNQNGQFALRTWRRGRDSNPGTLWVCGFQVWVRASAGGSSMTDSRGNRPVCRVSNPPIFAPVATGCCYR
jgi:hypothetical protein